MVLLAILIYVAVEVAAFVVVAEHIGVLGAVVLVLVVSAAGPFLVRRAGTGVVEHARLRIARGEAPDREVLDGVVLLLGGVLVCIPGFVGDVIGLLLLVGPVRHAVIRAVGHHLARRVTNLSVSGFASGIRRRPGAGGPVVDASTHDEPDASGPGAASGPGSASGPGTAGRPVLPGPGDPPADPDA